MSSELVLRSLKLVAEDEGVNLSKAKKIKKPSDIFNEATTSWKPTRLSSGKTRQKSLVEICKEAPKTDNFKRNMKLLGYSKKKSVNKHQLKKIVQTLKDEQPKRYKEMEIEKKKKKKLACIFNEEDFRRWEESYNKSEGDEGVKKRKISRNIGGVEDEDFFKPPEKRILKKK